MKKIGIIGGGSWATALIKILQENESELFWWMRDGDQMNYILKHGKNPKYLSSCELLKEKLHITTNLDELIINVDILIIATPSAFVYDIFKKTTSDQLNNKFIITAIKGIIPQTNQLPVNYFSKHYDKLISNIGIITGPCHAEEVSMERLSYLTVACTDIDKALNISSRISNRYIFSNAINDSIGAELSSVLKNVYALAAGVCNGLGYGDNFLAVLISNAIQELERFLNKMHPLNRDVKSSAYLGDLLVTAYSIHSRNRRFGMMIGKGYSVKATQIEMSMAD